MIAIDVTIWLLKFLYQYLKQIKKNEKIATTYAMYAYNIINILMKSCLINPHLKSFTKFTFGGLVFYSSSSVAKYTSQKITWGKSSIPIPTSVAIIVI